MWRGKLLLLRSRERESIYRARYARLSKVMVFCGNCVAILWQSCGTFVCTSKGYVERETSLASLKRERVTLQGSLCSPLKSDGFLWQFCGNPVALLFAPVRGMWRGKLLSLRSRERVTLQGSLCSPFKSDGFLWQFCGNSVRG